MKSAGRFAACVSTEGRKERRSGEPTDVEPILRLYQATAFSQITRRCRPRPSDNGCVQQKTQLCNCCKGLSKTSHYLSLSRKKLTNRSRLFFSHSTVVGQFLTALSLGNFYCRKPMKFFNVTDLDPVWN